MFSIFMLIPLVIILVLILAGIGVASFIAKLKSNNMEPNTRTPGGASDFFLHVGALITFYTSVIALITLLFQVIDYAYPKVANAYQYYTPSISLQVAILIVAFPFFLLFSWLLQKAYAKEPALRDAPVRKWLTFITLALAGGVVAGDLVTVLYMYLDGQDLTTGFLLKVLALVVIAGGIFVYYWREVKNVIGPGERNIWRVMGVLFMLGAILLGFSVFGSPNSQRERRYDAERVSDVQGIQWQLVNYWQQKGTLPGTLDKLEDSISGYRLPTDPKTNASYSYELTGPTSFKLCATFDRASDSSNSSVQHAPSYPAVGRSNESWEHTQGTHCFSRTIDPDLYPTKAVDFNFLPARQ
jgi:hypothetical protein